MLAPGVTLFHVRHGETDWNVEARLQGRTDTAMNARGLAQAGRNGRALAIHLRDAGIDPAALRWVASPLGRARLTMEIVRTAVGLPAAGYDVDERLLEIAFGEWSGRTIPELVAAGEKDRVAARRRDKWGFTPPGGESYADLAARIVPFLGELGADTVAVSHGGVYRVIHGLVVGIPKHDIPVLAARQDAVAVFRDGAMRWL